MAVDPEAPRRSVTPTSPAGATATGANGQPMTALERLRARMEAQQAATTPSGAAAPTRPPIAAPRVPTPGLAARPGGLTGAGAPTPRPGLATSSTLARPSLPAPTRPPLTAPDRASLRAPLTASAGGSTLAGTMPRPPLRAPLTAPLSAPAARPGAPDRPRPAFTPLPLPTLNEIEQTVDHKAYEAYSDAVKSLLGFDLLQYKRPQVWRRSNSFARQKGFDNLVELCEACKADLDLRQEMRDMITINVSEFFRNPDAWEQIRTMALPELLKLGRPIKFWSAGCSLGYEPYTWTMMIKEAGGSADTKILATDLDETILGQAKASVYNDVQMVGISPARKTKFFDERDGRWTIKPELRNMITWKRQDLLRDPFPSDMDMIACRNVVIYFTDDAKDVLYKRFAGALRPGGFLFIGATEAIADWRGFGLKMLTSGLYRKEA
jgi:chemotaxis protein methyltransferase CheR